MACEVLSLPSLYRLSTSPRSPERYTAELDPGRPELLPMLPTILRSGFQSLDWTQENNLFDSGITDQLMEVTEKTLGGEGWGWRRKKT